MNNEERDEQLHQIWELLRSMDRKLTDLGAKCPGHQEQTVMHRAVLYGNGDGSKGLITRVSRTELSVRWLWGIVSAVWAAVVGVALIVIEKVLGSKG